MNAAAPDETESRHAWMRLAAAVLVATVGGVGMWSAVVALPAVQADFGVSRADASTPYTAMMVGTALGGVVMGRLTDRFGVFVPMLIGAVALCAGYVLSGLSPNIWVFSAAHGLLIGFCGAAVFFGPLMADVSMWFSRRRGIAVALAASGNYLAGGIWPSIVEWGIRVHGWRATHIGIGLFCLVAILALSLMFRRRPSMRANATQQAMRLDAVRAFGIQPNQFMTLLAIAGVGCCVAMSMPQVHIVALCADLGYGVARGAEMLSLMLLFGIASRIGSGLIADRIGGLMTLLIGSTLQGVALLMYLFSDGLTALYVVSALFGLFQGGIVPMYPIIVREYFKPEEAGARIGVALMATMFGMAFGGWVSGKIYDVAGTYQAAFANGILWNLVNVMIVGWLILRLRSRIAPVAA